MRECRERHKKGAHTCFISLKWQLFFPSLADSLALHEGSEKEKEIMEKEREREGGEIKRE